MTTTWPEWVSGLVAADAVIPAQRTAPASPTSTTAAAFAQAAVDPREQARSAGWAEGWSYGAQAAQERTTATLARLEAESAAALEAERARLRAAAAALESAAADLRRSLAPSVAELSEVAMEAALVLAEAVVGEHVRSCPTPGQDALRRALSATADRAETPVTVRMNPADLASLSVLATADRATSLPAGSAAPQEDLLSGRVVHLVADASLPAGDSVAEHADGHVAVRLGEALARAREAVAR